MYQTWDELIKAEIAKPYAQELQTFLRTEEELYQVFPPASLRLNALQLTPLEKVRVVILGQDPYHDVGQAMGLSFSVPKGVRIPKSLQNIFQELHADLGINPPNHGDLTKWAKSGVLLLNTILTVRAHQPLSHAGQGWEIFTDEVIRTLNNVNRPIVFILWGKQAIAKKALLDNPNHLILTAPHPSPFSAYSGFLGSRPFSKANAFLQELAIDWHLD